MRSDEDEGMPDETRRGFLPIAAALAVALLGLATAVAAAQATLPGAPETSVIIADVAAGWSFAFVGAVLWRAYPASRIGVLSIAVGLASFLPDIRWFGSSFAWTAGSMLTDLHLIVLGWLILAFPTGRMSPGERIYVVTATVYFFALSVAGHLFEEPFPNCVECPPSFMVISHDPALNDLIWGVGQFFNLVLVGVLVAMIVRKWNRASTAARRGLGPVVWALGPIGLALIIAFLEPLVGSGAGSALAVLLIERLALILFPVALAIGMVRARLDRAKVADLAREVERTVDPFELEELIGAALGDSTARLGYWTAATGLVDAGGVELNRQGREETPIDSAEGEPLAVILHDPAVDRDLAASVGATASLAIRNESLRTQLRMQLAEVERSRERIAEAIIAERRKIERDLHDGAQQGLLALGASLGSIRSRLDGDVGKSLDDSIAELRQVIEQLRDLARGVHPPILTERGLGSAIEALAERSPLPLEISVSGERCRPQAEAAAYFLVSEGVANAAKHSGATRVIVVIEVVDGLLRSTVTDDGAGGARLTAGGGLQGLADRMSALGGRLTVTSPPIGGTTLVGVVPCGS